MGRVTLVTGGCRSGKSAYAQAQAEAIAGKRLYLATGPALDTEMARRIEAHRQARAGRGWETVEEPMDPARVLRESAGEYAVCLLDCLTLWVNNRMFEAERWGAIWTRRGWSNTLGACWRRVGNSEARCFW
jgi:adenosylcobinamide kinase/adenosylcobinamide-phosphate guanylyltransferase